LNAIECNDWRRAAIMVWYGGERLSFLVIVIVIVIVVRRRAPSEADMTSVHHASAWSLHVHSAWKLMSPSALRPPQLHQQYNKRSEKRAR